MHIQNCFHPTVYKNPYTDELGVGRCNHCEACANTRANEWVKRLDIESSCHKYTLFCTLTYDEQHVAQFIRLPFEDYNLNISHEKRNQVGAYIDYSTGEIIDFSEQVLQERDIKYLQESRVLNVLSKRDFQNFIKRLRYYFDQTEKGALLRYYICGEYGPSTFRPHGHLLLFFDSERCANVIESLLFKAWSSDGQLLGNVYDPHLVSGSAAQYCASYVNSITRLPRNYLHKAIRPFSLFSRRPSIGSLFPNVKEVRKIFDSGDIKYRRFCESSRSFKDEFFWQSFNTRLYPRLQRFGSLSHADRVTLYRLVSENYMGLSAREGAKRIKSEFIDNQSDTFLSRYFREIAFKKKKGIRFIKQSPDLSRYKSLPFLPKDVILSRPFEALPDTLKEYNEFSLVRFLSTCKRVAHQAQIFGVSIPYYVSKIEKYYDSLSYHRLVEDYDFQSQYFTNHPKWHFIYFDRLFYNKVTTSDYSTLSIYTRFQLNELFDGFPPTNFVTNRFGAPIEVVDIPPIDSIREFMQFKIMHLSISHDMTKQKENNDYALAHKDKFNNIIHYQNL